MSFGARSRNVPDPPEALSVLRPGAGGGKHASAHVEADSRKQQGCPMVCLVPSLRVSGSMASSASSGEDMVEKAALPAASSCLGQ
ncbi:hypothetical protein NEUTE1DRAFT_104364 [Neurospora tetrasperma FGSC 2508]|uniref:Uncharacterized protein n=1 Tax=Neurospora tetrasperma (strain FGSC 2508 / ATCC MYA-4615 / P0657) TaxID=510951 RepID=F8MXV3_NEUT8|nr:uncharacterized protein NEUTE1DRAFT_104364 [Neurospora tetrasperma FGSC 2508]EGO53870.1 hypothetical protein NEUTE1DRAFT_104364 [Neurospora tetrasperma FGSC 2508]EGZ71137.1 hypothetical protein NEUTE2DRAFT_133412 [Neurospora tetrasperma FGSC 2509]